MLTKQQKKLLTFIQDFQLKNGISPSYDEMRTALNQKSKSSVHMLLNALVERGFVRKLNNKARAIEILKNIPSFGPSLAACSVKEDFSMSVAKPQTTIAIQTLSQEGTVQIPFYGDHATPFPFSVFLMPAQSTLSFPKNSFHYQEGADYCCLKIKGDSLKDLAILDEDILIFKMDHNASSGQVVLALVEDESFHIKKYEQQDSKIILSAANKYMMPQVYDHQQVRVKGCLVALVRGFYK